MTEDTIPSDKDTATSSVKSGDLHSHKNTAPATNTPASQPNTQPPLDRWQLVWDVVIFQGKLVLDGGRDLLLSPLSIIAAIYALIIGSQIPGRQFYDLMHLGHRTDKWINLFGAAQRIPPSDFSAIFLNSLGKGDTDDQNVDNLVRHMEELVKRQYEKGGVTANAKTNIDKAFDKLNAKIHRTNKKP